MKGGFEGPRGTRRQKGKLAHRILRLVASVDDLTLTDLAELLSMKRNAVRSEVRVLRGAGLVTSTKKLKLTEDGNTVVTRLMREVK